MNLTLILALYTIFNGTCYTSVVLAKDPDEINVKLEIIRPEDSTIMYVDDKGNPVGPLTITIKITNLEDTTLVLTSNLQLSIAIRTFSERAFSKGTGLELWYNDNLILEPNKSFIYSMKLDSHNDLFHIRDVPPVLLGEHRIELSLERYIGLNPEGVRSWALIKKVEVPIDILARAHELVIEDEAQIFASIARKQARYFEALSNFLDKRMDPLEYAEEMSNEWKSLGDDILPTPQKIPMEFLLNILRAGEVKSISEICTVIVIAFNSLTATAFWSNFWMKEELRAHISFIIEDLKNISELYSEEADKWDMIAKGHSDYENLYKILQNEKDAINELINSLNHHIPAILSEFKVKAYQPMNIYKGKIKEKERREYEFKLRRPPEYLKIEILQEDMPKPSEFWFTRPSYNLELYFGSPLLEEWVKQKSSTGLKLDIGPEYSTIMAQLGITINTYGYQDLKLVIYSKDLGMDNWLTFWIDEGKKVEETEIEIILKHGKEESTYEDIYFTQAQALETFHNNLNNYLNYCKKISNRLINELSIFLNK